MLHARIGMFNEENTSGKPRSEMVELFGLLGSAVNFRNESSWKYPSSASNPGNACSESRKTSVICRPRNRKRESAYAAVVESANPKSVARPVTKNVFTIQFSVGRCWKM